MNENGVLDSDEIQEACKFTIFRTILEPITSHALPYPVVNPSGIEVGSNAQFEITVEPTSIADSEITWSSTNSNITFPNGNTGRSIAVRATGQGLAKLKVDIAGYSKAPPTIELKGLTNSTVPISFFIICDENGVPAVSTGKVASVLTRANEIYQQVAMTFVQKGTITYTVVP